MTPQIPGYVVSFEGTMRPIVVAIALFLIWSGAERMDAPVRTRYFVASALTGLLIAWLMIAQQLGSANVYFGQSPKAVPTVVFGFLVPLLIGLFGLRMSRSVIALASAIPLPFIAAAQVYRVAGVIFIVLWANGRMPWEFALPAGIGDVATGCYGLVVAALLAQNAPNAHKTAFRWTLFGIGDLVVAITMGALTAPGLPHLLALDAPNVLITSYPLVMVPTFAVPLALILHALFLWRLRREEAPAAAQKLALA
jgi:hypothetical protein